MCDFGKNCTNPDVGDFSVGHFYAVFCEEHREQAEADRRSALKAMAKRRGSR